MTIRYALQLQDVTLTLRGKLILDHINLTLDEGGFLGLIGPNGGGKTTLMKLILGLMQPDSGKVEVFGKSPLKARGSIGYVPQYARFDFDFPIRVLDVTLMGRLGPSGYFHLYSKRDKEIALHALEQVGMTNYSEQQIGKLSGGQLQRVLIARALTAEPNLLLLDEPTASLDTQIGQSFYQLLEQLSMTMTIVLVSHDIGVIAKHVKTIACLNRRLHYHHSKELTDEMLEEVYGCPVEIIAHGQAHRVLAEHHHRETE